MYIAGGIWGNCWRFLRKCMWRMMTARPIPVSVVHLKLLTRCSYWAARPYSCELTDVVVSRRYVVSMVTLIKGNQSTACAPTPRLHWSSAKVAFAWFTRSSYCLHHVRVTLAASVIRLVTPFVLTGYTIDLPPLRSHKHSPPSLSWTHSLARCPDAPVALCDVCLMKSIYHLVPH